jgi:enoyl-CoA hydratase/carnithine racemase
MTFSFANSALQLDMVGDHAVLTLNQPGRRNAMTQAMWAALPDACAAIEAAKCAKVMVLRGAGEHFAAGADISEFETVYGSREAAAAYTAHVAAGVEALARLSKPSIAMISGVCVGGGMAMALACDLRIAATDARMGITPARLGLVYSLSDTKRLVDVVGPSAARNILYTGEIFGAEQARHIGLVDALHEPHALESAVLAKVEQIASASQWTVRKAKQVVNLILSGVAQDTAQTTDWILDAVEEPDFAEGRAAFMAKRTPDFPFR